MNYIRSCCASVNQFYNRHVANPSPQALGLALHAVNVGVLFSAFWFTSAKVTSIFRYVPLVMGAVSGANLALRVALFIRDRDSLPGNQLIILHMPIVPNGWQGLEKPEPPSVGG